MRLLAPTTLAALTLAPLAGAQLTVTGSRYTYGPMEVNGNYVAYTYVDAFNPYGYAHPSTELVTAGFNDQFSSKLLPIALTNARGYEYSFTSLSTGAHPVRMSGIQYLSSLRTIHGGAAGYTPTERITVGFNLREFADANGNGLYDPNESVTGAPISHYFTYSQVGGNGSWDLYHTARVDDYVLGAHSSYVLGMYLETSVDQVAFGNAYPMSVITHENFGNEVDFIATTLPEPGTWAALGLGAAVLLRRRRRAGGGNLGASSTSVLP